MNYAKRLWCKMTVNCFLVDFYLFFFYMYFSHIYHSYTRVHFWGYICTVYCGCSTCWLKNKEQPKCGKLPKQCPVRFLQAISKYLFFSKTWLREIHYYSVADESNFSLLLGLFFSNSLHFHINCILSRSYSATCFVLSMRRRKRLESEQIFKWCFPWIIVTQDVNLNVI